MVLRSAGIASFVVILLIKAHCTLASLVGSWPGHFGQASIVQDDVGSYIYQETLPNGTVVEGKFVDTIEDGTRWMVASLSSFGTVRLGYGTGQVRSQYREFGQTMWGSDIVMQSEAEADCTDYMASVGCGWTAERSCAGQAVGHAGEAEPDWSFGYDCCCTQQLWKAPQKLLSAGAHAEKRVSVEDNIATCKVVESMQCKYGDVHNLGAVDEERPRLAVMVVGSLHRYYPESVFKHVVAPVSRAGYQVDYFALLATGPPAFHSTWYHPVPNPDMSDQPREFMQQKLTEWGREYGARSVNVIFDEKDMEIQDRSQDPHWKRFMGKDAWNVGMDNSLRTLKQLETLWNFTVEPVSRFGGEYSHVLYSISDNVWAADINMEQFPSTWRVYSPRFGLLCDPNRSKGEYKLGKHRFEQPRATQFVVGGRVAARFFSSTYTHVYHNPSVELDSAISPEDNLLLITKLKGIRWEFVPQDWMPAVRVHHVRPPGFQEPFVCIKGLSRQVYVNATEECADLSGISNHFCDDFL